MSVQQVVNPKTNRLVRTDTPTYRRLVRSGEIEDVTGRIIIPKSSFTKANQTPMIKEKPIPRKVIKQHYEVPEPEEEEYNGSEDQGSMDERLQQELQRKSVKVIKANVDKFQKVKASQEDTNALLKQLLYKKLIGEKSKPKKKKKSNVYSFKMDDQSESSGDASSEW